MPTKTHLLVTAGSTWSRSAAIGPFLITTARFPARDTIPPHTHDRPCIACMLGGSFDLSFRHGHTYACEPGTVALEPAGETHCNCMGSAGAEVLVVQPDPSGCDLPPRAARALEQPAHLRHPAIATLGLRMASELRRPDDVSNLTLEGLALELLAAVARLCTAETEGQTPRWLRIAEDFLHDHATGDVTCTEVAAAAGVHPAHLARVFRRHHRTSVGGYVRRLRLERAARTLVATDRSIAAIALEAGFADQSHFTRRFHEFTGVTPAAWRRAAPRRPNATQVR